MLSDLVVKNTKPAEKLTKLSDSGGLQLWVFPDGAKRWRLAYRFGGAQKTLALGVYPDLGLKDARAKREEAKKLLDAGTDPGQQKQLEKAQKIVSQANTFEGLARELIQKKTQEGKAATTLTKIEWLLGMAFPLLGPRPIAEITAPEVLAVLRFAESRGRLETARRMRAVIGEVFRFAIAIGKAEIDPTFALRGALAMPKVQHRAAIVEPLAFGALLRTIDGYEGAPEVRMALQLLSLTFVRPGELRNAAWSEINIENAIWIIPAGRMKMRRAHRVPLAPQVVAIFKELQKLTGRGDLLFPGQRSASRPISENTLNAALRRLGYGKDEMTGHGFRAAASSMLNECGLWNADAIEAQLAHVESNAIRKAYARAEYWDERVKMMTYWATRIDDMRRGGIVVPMPKTA